MELRPLALLLSQESLAICRLPADATVPPWAFEGDFVSITRTSEELAIVCLDGTVPASVRRERPWRRLSVRGPLEFSLVGVLASIAAPLAQAGISLFVVSTFDTDHVLVKQSDLERACAALRDAGHTII